MSSLNHLLFGFYESAATRSASTLLDVSSMFAKGLGNAAHILSVSMHGWSEGILPNRSIGYGMLRSVVLVRSVSTLKNLADLHIVGCNGGINHFQIGIP